MAALPAPPDFADFLAMSARLGSDILRTQGAGGNTSIKDRGVLWVKASGTWLRDARHRPIMVPVAIDPLLEALRSGDPRAETGVDFVVPGGDAQGLRPSIETSVHAVLPQRIVAHYHCVEAISLSVRADREDLVARRMAACGERFAVLPYLQPGTPLARAIDAVARERPDVVVLLNHGLIVCGETVEEVEARIGRVSRALSSPPEPAPAGDLPALEAMSAGTPWCPCEDERVHALALVASARRVAEAGPLYPDHVIFLGDTVAVARKRDELQVLAEGAGRTSSLVLVPDRGVLRARALTAGGIALVRCLAEIGLRVPADVSLVPLDPQAVAQLTDWEAEKYRQSLDRTPDAAAVPAP